MNPEQFLAELRARGGYRMNFGSAFGRGWSVVSRNLWPCIGVTFVIYLILGVAGNIPCLNLLTPFLLNGPLLGGLFFYFLLQVRNREATMGDAFSGFTMPAWGQLALCGTVSTLIILAIVVALVVPGVLMTGATGRADLQTGQMTPEMMILTGVVMLPVMYLGIAWFLSYPLVIDKRLGFWDAMELSRKVVNMRLGSWILLMLLNAVLIIAGVLVLCVGVLFVAPITAATLMVVYEDIFTPPGAAPLPAPAV